MKNPINNSIYQQAVISAAKNGHNDMLLALLKNITVNENISENIFLREALSKAIDNRHILAAIILINSKGTDIHYADEDGRTFLMKAAECGSSLLCRALTERSVDILAQDKSGMTALMIATSNRFKSFVCELSHHPMFGRNVNQLDIYHQNALTLLTKTFRPKIEEIILNALKSEELFTEIPKAFKAMKENSELLDCDDIDSELKIMQILIENKINASLIDYNDKTPLMYAAENGYHHLVKVLLHILPTAQIERADHYGKTARDVAEGKPKIIELFDEKILCDILDTLDEKECKKATPQTPKRKTPTSISNNKENLEANTPKKARTNVEKLNANTKGTPVKPKTLF